MHRARPAAVRPLPPRDRRCAPSAWGCGGRGGARGSLGVEPRCGNAAGGDREVFNHRLRAIVVIRHAGRRARRREDRPRLQRLQIERAALMTPRVRWSAPRVPAGGSARSPATAADLRRHGRLAVEPRRDAVVGELRVIEDVRAKDLRVGHVAERRSPSSRPRSRGAIRVR